MLYWFRPPVIEQAAEVVPALRCSNNPLRYLNNFARNQIQTR